MVKHTRIGQANEQAALLARRTIAQEVTEAATRRRRAAAERREEERRALTSTPTATRRRQAAAARRDEDRRALLSEAAFLRGALYRSLSETTRDVYGRPRLADFDLEDWRGLLQTLGPNHFIHAALEQRRAATARARADSDEWRELRDSG